MGNKNNKIQKFANNSKVDIYYASEQRYYYIRTRGSYMVAPINYDPWTGENLPENLRDQWFSILRKEYNIEFPLHEQEHLVPEEFKTDEWWQKRGL